MIDQSFREESVGRILQETSVDFGNTELFQYRLADSWNSTYQIGQRVILNKEGDRSKVTVTASEAQVIFGQAVISLANISSCCLVSSITAI
jgi:hypothetical protein